MASCMLAHQQSCAYGGRGTEGGGVATISTMPPYLTFFLLESLVLQEEHLHKPPPSAEHHHAHHPSAHTPAWYHPAHACCCAPPSPTSTRPPAQTGREAGVVAVRMICSRAAEQRVGGEGRGRGSGASEKCASSRPPRPPAGVGYGGLAAPRPAWRAMQAALPIQAQDPGRLHGRAMHDGNPPEPTTTNRKKPSITGPTGNLLLLVCGRGASTTADGQGTHTHRKESEPSSRPFIIRAASDSRACLMGDQPLGTCSQPRTLVSTSAPRCRVM